LLVDWSGEGAEVWQQRLAAASGTATVESVLRKAGVKVRGCLEICFVTSSLDIATVVQEIAGALAACS
jgi:hypothetical protein